MLLKVAEMTYTAVTNYILIAFRWYLPRFVLALAIIYLAFEAEVGPIRAVYEAY